MAVDQIHFKRRKQVLTHYIKESKYSKASTGNKSEGLRSMRCLISYLNFFTILAKWVMTLAKYSKITV